MVSEIGRAPSFNRACYFFPSPPHCKKCGLIRPMIFLFSFVLLGILVLDAQASSFCKLHPCRPTNLRLSMPATSKAKDSEQETSSTRLKMRQSHHRNSVTINPSRQSLRSAASESFHRSSQQHSLLSNEHGFLVRLEARADLSPGFEHHRERTEPRFPVG